ncbi:hypothetical protein VPH35_065654 [Triticum aestivum]
MIKPGSVQQCPVCTSWLLSVSISVFFVVSIQIKPIAFAYKLERLFLAWRSFPLRHYIFSVPQALSSCLRVVTRKFYTTEIMIRAEQHPVARLEKRRREIRDWVMTRCGCGQGASSDLFAGACVG